jgi:hypothetical protein
MSSTANNASIYAIFSCISSLSIDAIASACFAALPLASLRFRLLRCASATNDKNSASTAVPEPYFCPYFTPFSSFSFI